MYAFVSEERKHQKRNLFQLLKKLRLVLQPLMNSSPKLENLWHWRSHDHLQTSSCPKRRCCYYYRVKLCLLATFRLDPPPTVLGRQNLERKTQDFFARRI